MRMHRLLAFVLTAAAVLGLACSAQAAPAAQPKDTVVIDLINESPSLDPHLQWNPESYAVYRNIFDNLVTRDNDGVIVPQVASSWKFVSDTQVEFVIRDDITFHDGTKLTPEDVVFSVRRITDKAFSSPQRSQFEAIVKAEVTGPDTVTLYTELPYPPLLAQLVKLSIVPEAVVAKVGNEAFNLNPVGSGPYVFKEWQRGISISLTANPKYWGVKGQFPNALFRFVPDVGTRLADLRSGTADIVYELNPDIVATMKGDAGVSPRTALTERIAYLRPNNERAPTNNPLIRQAMAYAVDKQGIVDGLFAGLDKRTDVMLTELHAGWTETTGYPYDPAKARELVAQAGDDAKTEIIFATSPIMDQRVIQAVQQMLNDVGLTVRIEMMDNASLFTALQTGPLDGRPHLSYGRWSCACLDADGVTFPLLHESSVWSLTRRPDIDRELEAARSVMDLAERNKHYKIVNDAIARDVLLLPLYQCATIFGVNNRIEWQPTVDESFFINRMSWK